MNSSISCLDTDHIPPYFHLHYLKDDQFYCFPLMEWDLRFLKSFLFIFCFLYVDFINNKLDHDSLDIAVHLYVYCYDTILVILSLLVTTTTTGKKFQRI